MDINGKIIQFIGEQSGTSKAGNPWKKKEWVLETFDNYPKKVKFHIFGDRSDTINLEVGKDYTLSFDIESREFNGRWYTDISVYRAMDYVNPNNGAFQGAPQPAYGNPFPPQTGGSENSAAYGTPATGYPGANTFDPGAGSSEEDLPF